jgi:hypothetical protein
LLTTMDWTSQRSEDWVRHFHSVHQMLRSVIRVDPQRRVTTHLKRALSEMPSWSMRLADAPACRRFRDKGDYEPEVHVKEFDELPALLLSIAKEHLGTGEVEWSEIIRVVLTRRDAHSAHIVRNPPALMGYLVNARRVDETRCDRAYLEDFALERMRLAALRTGHARGHAPEGYGPTSQTLTSRESTSTRPKSVSA